MRQLIYSFIAPTAKNHHKAYVLQIGFLVPITSLLLLVHSFYLYQNWHLGQVKGSFSDLTSQEVVRLTNQQREVQGVPTLRTSPLLEQAAAQKAQHMIQTGVFEHYYQSGETTISPWQFVDEQGYDYFYAGENLGKDFSLAADLVQAWVDSPTHRENLLNPNYTEIGVAVVIGPYLDKQETSLVVQMFATPVEEALAANADLDPTLKGQINIAPLLEEETSVSQALLHQHPDVLWYATALVVILVGLSLVIEVHQAKKKIQARPISIDLWNH